MNYTKYRRFFSTHYLYADCKDYLADGLFEKRGFPVRFKGEFHNPERRYIIIHCKVKTKYEKMFEEVMKELHEKMNYYGWYDYDEFCKNIKERM